MAKKTVLILIIGFFATSAAAANDEVIARLSKEVTEWTIKLGDKVEQCSLKKKENPSPYLSVDELKARNLSREDAVISIAYLSQRNSYLCESNERIQLAFALGTLESAMSEYGIQDHVISDVKTGLIYPPTQYHELSIKYYELPSGAHDFFEETFGTEPFDSVKIFDSLPHF